jgi:uroporphyrinogen-III synthase
MRPRVLVVRSGANAFGAREDSGAVELVEWVSHAIEPVVPPEDSPPAERPDLAVFTSRSSVERAAGDPRCDWLWAAVRRAPRVLAVGPATAEDLRARGVAVSAIGEGSGEDLLEALPKNLAGSRVLLPCGEDAAVELAEGLRRRGARVDRVVVYRKIPAPLPVEREAEIVDRPFAAFCATSPAAARWLLEGLAEKAADRLRQTPAVVLGPSTRRFLEAAGVDRILVTPDARFASARHWLEVLATAPAAA